MAKIDLTNGAAPVAPAAGKVSLYTKNDKKIYIKDDTGLETDLTDTGATAAWGGITGTLSAQTDLQTALDAKVDENAPITPGTNTKLTYDAKGLVTAGAAATTADINDSLNRRYVTDAQLVVVGNTSGTNTGDQTITLTSEVTGSGTGSFAATLNKLAITNKTAVTPVGADGLLITDASDTDNLKKITVTTLGGALVAGATTQVQFNDVGSFGADIGLTYDKAQKALTSGYFNVGTAFHIKTGTAGNEVYIGYFAGSGATGLYGNNVYIGRFAGNQALLTEESFFFGLNAGAETSSMNQTCAFGSLAAYQAANSGESIFMSTEAGLAMSACFNSICIGAYSGSYSVSASRVTFLGYEAGLEAHNSYNSNFIGYGSGTFAEDCNDSVFIGTDSGRFSTLSENSVFIGTSAGGTSVSPQSIFIGSLAGAATTNTQSVSIGVLAGAYSTNASNSINIGYQAGQLANNSKTSIFIGNFCAVNDTVNNSTLGFWSIAIGPYAGTGGFSNSIAIGRGVINSASTQMNFGNVLYGTGIYNSNTKSAGPHAGGKIGIGITAPVATLDVAGDLRLGNSGTVFQKVLSATATLDFPSIAANGMATLTMTVTGATTGSTVHLGAPFGLESNLTFCGLVTSTNVVTIRIHNASGGAINPVSDTWRATVITF